MTIFDSSDIVLVSTTYYDFEREYDIVRSQLALETAKKAHYYGYSYIVVDGSPDLSFQKKLEAEGATVLREKVPGIGKARRQCIQAGYDTGKKIICYLDPEKVDFVRFVQKCAQEILNGKAQFIVPSRNPMLGYPVLQEHSEKFLNSYWQQLTGVPLDVAFGPRLFDRSLAYLFLEYDGKYGDKWDSIFIPLIRALKEGIPLTDVMTDFIYPPEQKEIEEIGLTFYDKRLEQVENLVASFKSYLE